MKDKESILSSYLPFWEKLDTYQKSQLIAASREMRYSHGKTVHGGSSECTGLLLVTGGQLRAYTVSEEGKELTLYRLFDRDMCLFSASCMINSISFEVLVSAVEDTEALLIPTDVYKRLSDVNAAVANYTADLMATHFSDVMWLMDQILNKKLDSRLAALLLEESSLHSSDTLTVTHEQLGNHLGSMREVITRMLKYLQSEGLVTLGRGSITITDSAGLRRLAGDSIR